MPNFNICKEFLGLRFIHCSTRGADLFREVRTIFIEARLNSPKLFSVSTDSCLSTLEESRS